MEISFPSLVRVPRVAEGCDDAKNVGRDGQQKRNNVAVAEGFNDGGKEIGDRAGGDEAKYEHHLDGGQLYLSCSSWAIPGY